MADKKYKITFDLSNGSQKSVEFTSPQGEQGKSAYEYALDGGYTGTEADFALMMATGYDAGKTVSGKVICFDADAGVEIEVDADNAEAVTLVHRGKNFMPTLTSDVTSGDFVAKVNDDGSITTVNAPPTSAVYLDLIKKSDPLYLPAGTYCFSAKYATNSENFAPVLANANDNTQLATAYYWATDASFVLSERTPVYCFILVGTAAVDSTVHVMLERTEAGSASEYEKYVAPTVYSGTTLPLTVQALAGTNILYTESEDVLTATVKKSVEQVIAQEVEKQFAVDWSAYGLPMLYLTGDDSAMTKENAVDLAYVYGDMTGTASVKWQGASSLGYPKKNYTIKFDTAFEAKEGWGEQKKYCFKANFIDHTHARNLMCASIWGDLVKSAVASDDKRYSLPNGGAVDGFPCIIMLNGEFHGLYTWNIPKDGWMLGMGSGAQECILCANGLSQPNADGFQTLETTLGTAFDLEYITDESDTDWALTSLNRMLSAVINSDGSDLDTTVAQYLDWDSVIDHYIQTVLTGARDCTFKNYLLSTYDGVKWFFTGYDMDSTFGLYWNGTSFIGANANPTFANYAYLHRAMELVKTYKKDALKARYEELRSGALSEVSITQKLTNYMAGIPSQVLDADAGKWPTIPSTSASNLAQMLNWYRLRCIVADAEIAAM